MEENLDCQLDITSSLISRFMMVNDHKHVNKLFYFILFYFGETILVAHNHLNVKRPTLKEIGFLTCCCSILLMMGDIY